MSGEPIGHTAEEGLATNQQSPTATQLGRQRRQAPTGLASRVGQLYAERLQELSVPIVLINNEAAGAYLYSISADDEQGARLAIHHLVLLGHQRIGYVGSASRRPTSLRRQSGYASELSRSGLASPPDLFVVPDAEGDVESGRMALDELLAKGVSAVFCYNDRTAIGLLAGARERGICVPDDLSVVGFDDIEPSWCQNPPLTTVHQPRFEMGQKAMRMMLSLLSGDQASNEVLDCTLVVRSSTAAK